MSEVERRPQNLEALELANVIRIENAEYLRMVKGGYLGLEAAVETCERPIAVGRVLASGYRIGRVRAMGILKAAGLSWDAHRFGGERLGGRRPITEAERARLLEEVRAINRCRRENGVRPA